MILPMKRINVLAMSYDEKAIMRTLQNIGAVELVQTEYEPPNDDECVRLRNERDRLSHALSVINPYAKKAPLIEILPTLSFEELEAGRQRAYAVIDDIEGAEAAIAQAKIKKAQCETKLGSLRPWETLGSSVEELADTRSVRFITGFIRHDRLEKLELPEGAFIRTVSPVRDDAVLIAAHESTLDALGTALRELDFQEYRFPTDMKGSVPDAMNALLGDIAAQKDIIDKANARLLELSDSKGDIKCALDSVCVALEREETALRLGTLGSVFMLDGWIRAEDEELVKNTISGATDTFYFSARDPYDDEEPPTSVRNSKVAEPFESVTNMYSPPAYRGIDAASAITPFYLLFFGMMLADTGYGILLAIGGFLYSKIVRPKGGVRSLAKVMAMCGLSTIVCGLAFGTFFGMSWTEVFGEAVKLPFILDPMNEIMTMIYICCGLGIFHMMTGIVIKMYMCFRDGDWQSAIFDNLSWIFLVLGLIGVLVLGMSGLSQYVKYAWISTAVGAAMILFFKNRTTWNPIKRIASGLGAIYGITSYLGDTLSYVRILALGLVGGAMGSVFNLVGGMVFSGLSGLGTVGTIIGFVIAAAVLAVLHAFSLFINVLGTYVHCARLQYVEFFGKFYEANGRLFKPLTLNTRYSNLRGGAE